jgi:hypothetical protein
MPNNMTYQVSNTSANMSADSSGHEEKTVKLHRKSGLKVKFGARKSQKGY